MSHQIALALWQAWMELNEIRARDGVPWTHQRCKACVDESYFSRVVDDCETAYKAVTGKEIQPWPPMPDQFPTHTQPARAGGE